MEALVDYFLDAVVIVFSGLVINYAAQLHRKYHANPNMFIVSPLVMYKYFVIPVGLILISVSFNLSLYVLMGIPKLIDEDRLLDFILVGLSVTGFLTMRRFYKSANPADVENDTAEIITKKTEYQKERFQEEFR